MSKVREAWFLLDRAFSFKNSPNKTKHKLIGCMLQKEDIARNLIRWRALQLILKFINNSSRENKENRYRDRGLDM